MPLSLTRGVGNLTSLISLSTTTGLAMLGGTLLPVRDNGGTLLGGVGGEYGLYLLLLALGMGFSMTMAAIAQWLMYPDNRQGSYSCRRAVTSCGAWGWPASC